MTFVFSALIPGLLGLFPNRINWIGKEAGFKDADGEDGLQTDKNDNLME